ncbi:hypothetical protein OE88DRAFT_1660695 [Heliocybe sulcata]|uniref:Uncharacterized protein n=1 Tax=Heliocybe sulcata TaxID=5364 RepID=A0A5C3MYS9_9AGAM|nr:hypothetical protein OE88DRAFT_1660695 [Heliocybe sulcata]
MTSHHKNAQVWACECYLRYICQTVSSSRTAMQDSIIRQGDNSELDCQGVDDT